MRRQARQLCRHGREARQSQALDTGFVAIVKGVLNPMLDQRKLRQL